uniref:Chitin-binding type-2 domain-containing protein n=1 Tax=Musca domestica TaxID=7370 RepID=A0A1I8MNR4_MUSDO
MSNTKIKIKSIVLLLVLLQLFSVVTSNAVTPNSARLIANHKQCHPFDCPFTTTSTVAPIPVQPIPICNNPTPMTTIFLQLLLNSCHDCTNPNCSSSPAGATFPYPNHCQLFFKCECGVATICYCPNGTWYDRQRKVCDLCPNVTNCPANAN